MDCSQLSAFSLYQTADGGATWTLANAPANPLDDSYVGVSFVDRQTGYVVTAAGYLLRTDDGGQTFAAVDDMAEHTAQIQFITRAHGWEARGGQLFETTDGGLSWTLIPLAGFPVQQFALLPGGQAWISTGYSACQDDANPNRTLLSTSDGGRTWRAYRLGKIPCDFRQPGLDSLQFSDSLHGWLRGDTTLYYTADGGEKWVQLH